MYYQCSFFQLTNLMIPGKINQWKIILASASPRRQMLLKEMGVEYQVIIKEVEENYPFSFKKEQIPIFLAELKASAFDKKEFDLNTLLITADTVVFLEDKVVGKPVDYNDALNILKLLSGRKHKVITAVCLTTLENQKSFYVESEVYFRKLEDKEIEWYVNKYKPLDKAGAYGIQEWIGYVGIERIEGSFYNVMGLPTERLYLELMAFEEL